MENNSIGTFDNLLSINNYQYSNYSENISYSEQLKKIWNVNDPRSDNNVFLNILHGFLPLYVRAGFILVQISCIPTSNTNHIILQNIIDFAVATISYCLIGSTLAFGKDIKGVIGQFSSKSIDVISANLFMYGWACVMITTGIITTMFAGRMHTIGYTLLSFLTAGFLQPIFMHWLWDKRGFLRHNIFQNHCITFIDNSGISNIHVCAGTIALIGHLCFGRKLIKLKDLDRNHLASVPLTFIGYFLIISGLIENIPPLEISQSAYTNHMYYVINFILALSGGIIGTAAILKFTNCIFEAEDWLIARYMQGGIMGIVTISGGIYIYSPIVSFILGILSSVTFVSMSRSFLRSAFDDYCHIVPIHLIGGLIGLVMPTIFMCSRYILMRNFFIQFGWQLTGFFSIVFVTFLIILPLFSLLKVMRILRNEFEEKNHRLAMETAKKIPPQDFFKRLYKIPKRRFVEECVEEGCFCTKVALNSFDKLHVNNNTPQ